jgi:hypothetical protein
MPAGNPVAVAVPEGPWAELPRVDFAARVVMLLSLVAAVASLIGGLAVGLEASKTVVVPGGLFTPDETTHDGAVLAAWVAGGALAALVWSERRSGWSCSAGRPPRATRSRRGVLRPRERSAVPVGLRVAPGRSVASAAIL